jgi:beta-RFAP synthase
VFGGIGMMIDEPSVTLFGRVLENNERDETASDRSATLLSRIREVLPEAARSVRLDLQHEIPPHAGLGSGTQLALATCEAFCKLQGIEYDFARLMRLSGRGERSAIGLFGYQQGGFLIDAGHSVGASQGSLAARINFPTDWRILLLRPKTSQGLHGPAERRAFEELNAMPEALTGQLCRLVLTEILPSLQAADFPSFAESITDYGHLIGEFFAPLQGGVFSSQQMSAIAERLQAECRTGIAQSSWGPTLAVFAESFEHAEAMQTRILSWDAAASCCLHLTKGRNTGRTLDSDLSESTDGRS